KYTEYYNDLNFFVGGVDSCLVFGGEIEHQIVKYPPYSKGEWDELKKINSALQGYGDPGIITSSIKEIEEKYKSELNSHINLANTKLIKRSEDLQASIANGKQKVTSTISERIDYYSKIKDASGAKGTSLPDVALALSLLEEFKDQIGSNNEIECPTRAGIPKAAHETLQFLYNTRNE